MAAGQTEISFLRNNLNARLVGGEGRKLCADLEDMAARGDFAEQDSKFSLRVRKLD
jgi:hypothetical protein